MDNVRVVTHCEFYFIFPDFEVVFLYVTHTIKPPVTVMVTVNHSPRILLHPSASILLDAPLLHVRDISHIQAQLN